MDKKVAIVGCSNGLSIQKKKELEALEKKFRQIGLIPQAGSYIFEKAHGISGSGEEKAKELLGFFKNQEISEIFDVSGGDMANEILPYLDFEAIKESKAIFWGYSDLTTILNAIYAKTGRESVLYQVRNLLYEHGEAQTEDFRKTLLEGEKDLFSIEGKFIQGEEMQGIVVGGNIRCLLKLAGTQYFPDMHEKILLLEARSGKIPQMITYLSQLKMLGVFEQITGIILGTFTQMDEIQCQPDIIELVLSYVKKEIPVFQTGQIGHGSDSKAIVIGKEIRI